MLISKNLWQILLRSVLLLLWWELLVLWGLLVVLVTRRNCWNSLRRFVSYVALFMKQGTSRRRLPDNSLWNGSAPRPSSPAQTHSPFLLHSRQQFWWVSCCTPLLGLSFPVLDASETAPAAIPQGNLPSAFPQFAVWWGCITVQSLEWFLL